MWGLAGFFFSFIMCVSVHVCTCAYHSMYMEVRWQLTIVDSVCLLYWLSHQAWQLSHHPAEPSCWPCAGFSWYLCSWGLVKSHRILHFFFFDTLGQEDYGELSWLSNCKQVYFNDLFVLIQNCKRNGGCHCPIVCLMRGTRLILGMTSLTEKHVKKTHKAITSEIPQKLGLARTGSSIWRLFWGTRKDPVRPSTVSESQCHGASRAKDKFLVGTVI